MAFDELTAKAGLAGELCHGCGQPMKFRACKVSEYQEGRLVFCVQSFTGKEDDWCFVCHDCNLVIPYRVEAKVKIKKRKSGGNRRRR